MSEEVRIKSLGNECYIATRQNLTDVGPFRTPKAAMEYAALREWTVVDTPTQPELKPELKPSSTDTAGEFDRLDRLRYTHAPQVMRIDPDGAWMGFEAHTRILEAQAAELRELRELAELGAHLIVTLYEPGDYMDDEVRECLADFQTRMAAIGWENPDE